MNIRFYVDALMFPAKIEELKKGVRLTGSDPARYRMCLERLRKMAIIADQGGMEGICFSEQHANIEGVTEISTNPIILDTYLAGHTKRIKLGQLGMVLTATHPFRMAEDIAMLDQVTGGRAFFGVARGNAKRWVNMFAQHFGVEATDSDKSATDEQNMRAIKEAWEIIRLAWTKDTFSYQGEFWSVPARDTKWHFGPTLSYGQGMEPDGTLREIGLVPRPLQQPFPRVFAPLAFRMTTAAFWVEQGATAVCFASNDDFMKTAYRVLTEKAAMSVLPHKQKPLAPGVFLMLGKTKEDAERLRQDYEWLFKLAYSVPPYNVPLGRYVIGTPDDVSRQIEDLQRVLPFDEMFLWHNIGLHEDRLEMNSIELFTEKVIPRFAASARSTAVA